MPLATPEIYEEMLDRAKERGFAYPAINVTSSSTMVAAMAGFAEAESDGIVQISTGGASFFSGGRVNDMVAGASAAAEFAHSIAPHYPTNIALHTDHCPADKLDSYMRPLVALSKRRVAEGLPPLFNSHMWDGSAIELEDNLRIADELLVDCAEAQVVMELEIGVVGGEEDDVSNEMNEKIYTSPRDMLRVVEVLGPNQEKGRYLLAAVFGNVHGVYKPGHVKLRPEILGEGQQFVAEQLGLDADAQPFDLVFHGGSGSTIDEIHEAIDHGVVKMNIDTDTQYAYTRPVAGHMFTHYEGVLKVDGEVGVKKAYDPRTWMRAGEQGLSARVVEACETLRSTATTLGR